MSKRGWLICASAFFMSFGALTFSPMVTAATAQVDEETERLFTEAVAAYRQGDDAKGLELIKQVLSRDPSNEEAYRLREKFAMGVWVDLLLKGGENRAVINTFLDRARVGERTKRDDAEAINQLLEEIRGGDFAARRTAELTLERAHGDYAVPYIVEALASSGNDDFKTNLLRLLTAMGPEATLPLMESLDTSNDKLKTDVCIALGLIKDDRAAGALKAVVETAKDPGLVAAADRALRNMHLPAEASGRSAKELLVDLASRYYDPLKSLVMKEVSANRPVWKWADGKLGKYDVPVYLYHLEVAEEACYDALSVDPEYQPAQTWLARIHLAQMEELSAATSRGSEGAEELKGKMAKSSLLAATAGVDNLEEAVRACIKDRDLAVAERGIFTLRDLLGSRGFQGGVLTDALTSEYKVIRYAAAIAIGELAPAPSFANAEAVVPELARCVGESTRRAILVIDNNDDTRNQLLSELRELGYFAVGANDGADGVMLAKRGPNPDLVIVRTTLAGSDTAISAQGVVNELKSDERTKEIPILGLTAEDRADSDEALFGGKVAGMVKVPLVKDAYAGTVKDSFGARTDDQARALAYSERAATALAGLAATAGSLDPSAAFANLQRSLGEKPDNVKLPAIKALGGIGNTDGYEALAKVFGDDSAGAPVRAAAAKAIGQIARAGGSLPEPMFQALIGGLGLADLEVAGGAAEGLGIAPLNASQRAEVATKHRISLSDVFGG